MYKDEVSCQAIASCCCTVQRETVTHYTRLKKRVSTFFTVYAPDTSGSRNISQYLQSVT